MAKHRTEEVYGIEGKRYGFSTIEEKDYNPDMDERTIEERVNSGDFQLSDFEELSRLPLSKRR
jgi:hypothetical protein